MKSWVITCSAVLCIGLYSMSCGTGTRHALRPRALSEAVFWNWKMSLDSARITDAVGYMAHPSGRRFVAVESYEMRDDVSRWQRILHGSVVSDIVTEVETETSCRLLVEIDYHDMYLVTTARIADSWYITSVRPRTVSQ